MTLPTKLLLLFLTVLLAGCYSTPVRHLTADVSLLKAGESTEQDVLIYLGEPDQRQKLGEATERWVYAQKEMSFAEKLPLIGGYFGAPEYQEVVVTLTGGVVSGVAYSSADQDDQAWTDDFSWQGQNQ